MFDDDDFGRIWIKKKFSVDGVRARSSLQYWHYQLNDGKVIWPVLLQFYAQISFLNSWAPERASGAGLVRLSWKKAVKRVLSQQMYLIHGRKVFGNDDMIMHANSASYPQRDSK